jgi:hypothetical protein
MEEEHRGSGTREHDHGRGYHWVASSRSVSHPGNGSSLAAKGMPRGSSHLG